MRDLDIDEVARRSGVPASAASCGPPYKDTISIAMGAFETPTDTKLAMHIFVANKGDYYEIGDGVTQHQQ